MKRVEAYHILAKMWDDATPEQREAIDIATDDIEFVDLMPNDMVAVVRCKDCKWYTPDTDWGFDEATGKRDHSKIVTKPYGECHGQDFDFTEDGFLRAGENDFCSCGERREDHACT